MEKKILIVNVNWVGDVIFSTPFIRAVRERYPKSYIACLLHPRCREVLEGNPRLNEIIIYDEESSHRTIWGKLRLIAELKRKRFDVAFLLHRSFTKALITALAGVKERIGYPTKHRDFLLTKAVEEPDEDIHKVEYFLDIARATGIMPSDPSYEFFVKDADRAFIKDYLSENGLCDKDKLVVICPGGNWGPKRWPKENFAKLADALSEKFAVRIVISGAAKDIALAEEIKGMVKNSPIVACGRMTLKNLGALLERANLVIANDTGPMHIAVAVKARVIALFGPTSPKITGPYGSGNYRVISRNESCDTPCYDFSCTDNKCMKSITVDEVLKAAIEMLTPNSKPQAPS